MLGGGKAGSAFLMFSRPLKVLLQDLRDLEGSFSSATNCWSQAGARAPWQVQSEPERRENSAHPSHPLPLYAMACILPSVFPAGAQGFTSIGIRERTGENQLLL